MTNTCIALRTKMAYVYIVLSRWIADEMGIIAIWFWIMFSGSYLIHLKTGGHMLTSKNVPKWFIYRCLQQVVYIIYVLVAKVCGGKVVYQLFEVYRLFVSWFFLIGFWLTDRLTFPFQLIEASAWVCGSVKSISASDQQINRLFHLRGPPRLIRVSY
jgi:hypothetical protein